jgi:Phosphatidylinositol-4-phosphate 5-Kinase
MKLPEVFEDYKLDVFDTYSFIMISPVSALASLVLFVAHVMSKELRKQPGDLILMISFSEFILSIHFFAVAYATSYISTGTQEDSYFCRVNSVMAVISQVMEFCYSMSFLIHIYFTINSSIQKGFIPKKIYHFFTMLVVIISVAATWNLRGKDPYGICSLKVGKLHDGKQTGVLLGLILSTIALLIGVFLAIFVLIYTQKKLPKFGRELSHLTRDFLNYYKTYIKACILIWLIIFGSFIAQIFGEDQRLLVEEQTNWLGSLFDIGRVGNTAKVLMPLIFFFVRIQDPLIRKKIWSPFAATTYKTAATSDDSKTVSAKNQSDSGIKVENSQDDFAEEDSENLVDRQNREKSLGDPLTSPPACVENKRGDLLTEEHEIEQEMGNIDDDEDMMWMNWVQSKIKESYTRTFLACIYITYEYWLNKKKGVICSSKQDTQDVCPGRIKGKTLMKHLKTDKSIVDCTFAIYAPALFREVIESRAKKISIKESLDIFKNEDRIRKAGESGGGASGELFMFSHDGQLILKTAHHEEIKMFEDMMLSYKDHIKNNPNTQISRIYGLFDFRFRESDKSIKLILMENLFTIDPEKILRKYDLKGSRYARRALKNKGGETYSLDLPIKKVMKDLDFLELDKEIEISPDQRIELMRTLEVDVEYFRKNGIIDFSVVIAVVGQNLIRSTLQVYHEKTLTPSARSIRTP